MTPAMRCDRRTGLVLATVSLLGLAMFGWPLWINPDAELAHSQDASLMFAGVLAMLVVVLGAEISRGGIDAKALALLGLLSALAAALYLLPT